MKFRYLMGLMTAAVFTCACPSAFAGWGDVLSNGAKGLSSGIGIGGSNSSKGSFDVGNAVQNLRTATREVPEEEEIGIGRQFASVLVGAKPLVDDPALQRYVNTLGRWLAMQSDRPDLPWTFAVLDSAGFNAFATPGGYVFVTKGLVDRMHNEAELAGVLAHEIAHVQRKHHLRAVQKNAAGALLIDAAGSAVKANDTLKGVALDAVKKIYSSGLSHDDEFEADRVGVVIAARAGYDAYGLPAVLQMLEAQNPADGNFSLMFTTHPSPAERIEALDRRMDDRFAGLSVAPAKTIPERLAEFGKSGGQKK